MRSIRQQGMSLFGFIIVLIFVLFFVYIGIKLVPIYINHFSVVSEINALADEPGLANQPPNRIRNQLITRMDVSMVRFVTAEHIRIERADGVRVIVEYEVREHLIGNIDAVVHFRREQTLN